MLKYNRHYKEFLKTGKTYLFRYFSNYWVILDAIEDGGGSTSNAVTYQSNGSGVSGMGPVHNIQVVTTPGTDTNTLYIVV